MGKVGVPSKQSEKSVGQNRSTRVIKQAALTKSSQNVRYKRLIMLKRRLNSVMNEKNSWEEKNKDLSDALKTQKLLAASLKKESFHWQKLYHESSIIVNSYKVKQFEMAEALALCLREIDSIYPHMVAFSESVTSNKIRLSNLINSLPSSEHSFSLKRFQNGKGITEEYKQNGNPTQHKVGPMVKGLQIVTKPKIMIERLTLPQVQVQDQVNDDLSHIEVDNQLTSIPEENEEDPCYRHISIRPRRSKLGTTWRRKRQEQMKKDKERDRAREHNSSIEVPYSEDSSESDDVPPTMEHVSRLIKNSTLHKVDPGGRSAVGESVGRQPVGHHFSSRPDDPLEGSSWMYTNCYRPPHSDRQSSIYKSDSSEDEEPIVVKTKSPKLSMNTLIAENQTFNDSLTNQKIINSGSFKHNTSKDYSIEEPDSTNNDSNVLNKNSLSSDSSENLFKPSSSSSTVSSSRNSPELSTDYGTANNTMEQQLSNHKKMPSVRLSKVPFDESTSRESSIHSNVHDSPVSAINGDSGKRIRKPANHRYPSEDYIVTNVKVKQSKIARLSSEKKSPAVNGKAKIKEVKGLKKRVSADINTNVDINTGGFNVETSNHDAVNGSDVKNSSKSKISTSKKSHTPDNSRKSRLSTNNEDSSRPRRNKSGNVCYKEPPRNTKKRRP